MADHDDARSGGNNPKADAEAIRNIIRATVSAAGEPDPDTLPHLVRKRLEGQATGEVDVDAYVREVLAEMRKA
jgi:hypothetical protein